MSKSFGELMRELRNDEDFQKKKKQDDTHFEELGKMYEKDEEELVADLRQIGFQISSVWDFVNSNKKRIWTCSLNASFTGLVLFTV